MSAHIVSEKVILLLAAIYHEQPTFCKLDLSSCWYIQQTAEELQRQNYHSVKYVYTQLNCVEQIPECLPKVNIAESWETIDKLKEWLNGYSVVEKIKLVQYYMYQSSEHPEWEFSLANKVCKTCLEKLIAKLPGWEEAPWGVK